MKHLSREGPLDGALAMQDRADIVEYIGAENPRGALKMDQLFSHAVE
ncbi:hypothetical protein ACUN9Y_07085 [Halomonas sp. V046]